MPGRALMPVTLALLIGLFVCLLFAKPAATLPNGFTDEPVTSVPAPTALAFTPDGRLLIASRPGKLRVYENGALVGAPALDLETRICDNKERGLLGLAVDPDFGTTGNDYVYLYYTYKKFGKCPQDRPQSNRNPVNRVSRFVLNDDNTVDEDSEEILINNIPSPNGNHNGGDLHFGKDGNLYVSVGDGGCNLRQPSLCQYENAAARYRNIPLGKILRVEPDGDIPPDNPFTGPNSGICADDGRTARDRTCREIFALGFRNPFRFDVDPDAAGTILRINDVGGQRWEEIDELDAATDAGADYGWNLCEANRDNPERRGKVDCDGARYTGPIHQYEHDARGCESITGGAFVPDGAAWPPSYDDSYLFADFVCGRIFELTPNGGGFSQTEFTDVPGQARPVAMTFGSHEGGQALYYTVFDFNGGPDQVRRIAYTGP